MLQLLAAFCALMLATPGLASPADPVLLPLPQSYVRGTGELALGGPLRVEWSGYRDSWLNQAVGRNLTGPLGGSGSPAAALRISCKGRDPHFLGVDASEAYTLRIEASGIILSADGPTGILRGLATLRQLAARGSLPFITINDAPRFRWRGLMIDVARHFMSIDSLKRQIDAMEAVKLNVLHLHLSDNEGFRVESRTYPRLTEGQGGQFYTQAQLRDLIDYARDRGIRIVPEFDVPGHSLAILRAYPELSSAPPSNHDYISATNSVLNPASPATHRFIARFFGEMAGLFPDAWFHVGGDEVRGADWDTNPAIQSYMRANKIDSKAALQADFMRRVYAVLHRKGKTMIGWDEVTEANLPADVAVQIWRGGGLIAPIADRGHRIIVSSGYYLDLLQPAAEHYLRDPLDPAASGLNEPDIGLINRIPAMASFYTPETVERLRIGPGAALTTAQAAKVLGGEGALWSEIVSDEMLDVRLWPRTAALAERFWSPASARDVAGLYKRLEPLMQDLRSRGLRDEVNRAAMLQRLAPGLEPTVSGFLDLVGPTRNHTHFHALRASLMGQPPTAQSLTELADIAAPDSFTAARIDRLVTAFLAGDRAAGLELRAELVRSRAVAAAFRTVAPLHPALAAAEPVARDAESLAAVGIEALDALLGGAVMTADRHRNAQSLLNRQAAATAASATILQGFVNPQPPADLLILFAPSIARLEQASAKRIALRD